MRASFKRFAMPIAAVATLATVGLPAVAVAAPDPTTGVELGVEQDQFVAVTATFDPGQGRAEGIEAIKELRALMWEKNPPYRGYGFEGYTGTLQDAAAKEGLNTKEDYVNAVQADENMNWIAIQRALENAHLEELSHDRPNGPESKIMVRDGNTFDTMESLSAGPFSMREQIVDQMGKGEYQALVNLDGKPGDTQIWNAEKRQFEKASSGHLMHLLYPRYKNYGVGLVWATPAGKYGGYLAVKSFVKRSCPRQHSSR